MDRHEYLWKVLGLLISLLVAGAAFSSAFFSRPTRSEVRKMITPQREQMESLLRSISSIDRRLARIEGKLAQRP